MKIKNISTSHLTFGYGDDAVTLAPDETSGDLKLKADDIHVAAHLAAQNIEVTGRGAPKADEPAAH